MDPLIKAVIERMSDPWWRLENLYQILDEDGRTVPLKLRDEQREYLENRHTRNFVPKARKLGMSTAIVIANGDACMTTADFRAGIIDLKEADAFEKLEIFRFAWNNGPLHPDPAIAALWKMIHQGNPLVVDSKGKMEWANGASYTAGTSYVGKTPQALHISEYGPISARFPSVASAIKRGSMNAVPPDGIVDIETTMEGGRDGECYKIFKLALESAGKPLTKLDWKLHFFSWLRHPSYVLPGCAPSRADVIKYFAEIREKHGIEVPLERQAWYERKSLEQGDEMWQQFPTVIDEVDRLVVPGQIYPEMKTIRTKGHVCEFEAERGVPIYSCWDLGSSDNSAGWAVQPAGKAHNLLAWSAGEGKGAPGVAAVIREWEAMLGPFAGHFLPHDCEITDKGSGKTYVQQLVECGIPRAKIIVVPRIRDVWVGIGEVRKILPHCWFHARCDEPMRSEDGSELPSGVARLEAYRKKIERSTGILRDTPVGDYCSHTADALRTYAEALSRDLVGEHLFKPGKVSVAHGWRGDDDYWTDRPSGVQVLF
jgi:hypothetical protein